MLGSTSMRGALTALLVAALAASAGCGRTKDDDGLAKGELIKRADAICASAGEKTGPLLQQLFPNGDETPPAATAAPIVRQVGDTLAASYADLVALEPAKSNAKAYAAWLVRYKALVDAGNQAADLAEAGDTEGYLQHVQSANDAYEAMGKSAAAFGFETCGAS